MATHQNAGPGIGQRVSHRWAERAAERARERVTWKMVEKARLGMRMSRGDVVRTLAWRYRVLATYSSDLRIRSILAIVFPTDLLERMQRLRKVRNADQAAG